MGQREWGAYKLEFPGLCMGDPLVRLYILVRGAVERYQGFIFKSGLQGVSNKAVTLDAAMCREEL